ncbi:MAG: hypothetical protein LAQ69_12235 [Acidobacteriia bacterium]|nr:hypothetical protein [Terriglobia bacterium]
MRTARCAFIVIALFGACELRAQGRGRKPDPSSAKPSCADQTEGRLSFGAVILLVMDKNDVKCVVQYVQRRDVDFYRIPLVIEVLKDIRAPDGLIDLIKPPPPPPPPVLGGPLTIFCEPTDCEVIVNNHYYGRTEGRKKVVSDLSPGEAEIRVGGDGLEPETKRIPLTEAAPRNEPFTLRPNLAARRQDGRRLLLSVVSAFGGVQGLAVPANLAGQGKATVLDGDKQAQEWQMSFSQGWNVVSMKFVDSKLGECTTTVSVGKPPSGCTGKLTRPKDEAPLKNAAATFGKYQIHTVLAELLGREVVASPDSAGKIETDSGPDSYAVSLNDKGLPSEIVYREKPDASPIKIAYQDYAPAEGHPYPRRITISGPSAEKPLADFAVTSIGPPPPAQTGKKGKQQK